jgi:hypothetical protein
MDKEVEEIYNILNKLVEKIERGETVSSDEIAVYCLGIKRAKILATCDEATVLMCPWNDSSISVCVFVGEKQGYKKLVSIKLLNDLFKHKVESVYNTCLELTMLARMSGGEEVDNAYR